jgi:DNA (cytosine-5)-methyltransferase 1
LTVGSLFSGIGGIDLGLERAGMTVKWQSEIDPYACRVLKKHWPHVPNLGNIKEINWKEVEKVDVICGGYPCQPFSTAGKRNGEEDPRHLWPWVREAISELRPQYAILENVRGHLSLGGLSVIGELASIGYDAEWRVISAASVGANHKRDRIVIVAYPSELFSNGGNNNARVGMESKTVPKLGNSGGSTDVADPDDAGSRTSERRVNCDRSEESQEREFAQFGFSGCGSEMANTASQRRQKSIRTGERIFSGNNVGRSSIEFGRINGWWETEPDVGRVAHGIPSRLDRLKGLGNAVVPQVAEVVGRLILQSQA